MKKVIILLLSFLMLIGNVFAYNSYENYNNDKINLLATDDPNNEIRNYTFYAIMKYMGFNLPSGSMINFIYPLNTGETVKRNTLLVNAIGGFNAYKYLFSSTGLENENSQYYIDYDNMSENDILYFEKQILSQLRNYIVNDNKLVVVDDDGFILNDLGPFDFEVYDRNVSITNTFTPTGSAFQIQNKSITKSNNLKYIKYVAKNNGQGFIYIPVNSNNNGGVSAPIMMNGGNSFGKYINTYSNGSYTLYGVGNGNYLDINNSSNIDVKLMALEDSIANNLMYDQFPVNQSNEHCDDDNTKKCLLALIGNTQSEVNQIYFNRNAIISANQLNGKYIYGYYNLDITSPTNTKWFIDVALSEDYGITDINNFVANTNIVNMSDSELLNLIPKDENGNLDLSELRSLAPTLNDLLDLPNNEMPNYNGGSSSGGSDEPTPSTPSDIDYDYGLSDEQVEILNENTALGTIGKILAKGFEFIATPLAKGAQALNDWLKKLFGAVDDAPSNLWNFFKSGFNNLRGGLNSITQSISNIASDLWNSFKSGFDSLGGFIDDVAKGLQSQIDVLSQGLSDITEAIGNITQNIVTNITNVFSDVVEAINGLALGFWDYFKNGFQWIKDSIDGLTSQILASLTNLGSSINNALGNIWNGFINLFTIPEGDNFINDGLSELNTLVSNKWNFDDLTGFLNILKNGSIQNNVLNDEYINIPELLGGNSAKIIDYSFIRNNIETIRNLQRFGLYSVMALNIKDCISGVIRNDS